MPVRFRLLCCAVLSCALGATACSDDPSDGGSTDTGTDTTDTGADVADDTGDDTSEDTGEDTSVDAEPDAEPDVEEDALADVEVDAPVCGGETQCIDERTGRPSLTVCREAGYPEGTLCIAESDTLACCVPPFACETDDDCEAARADEGFCPDDRYGCTCVVETGTCVPDVCSTDAECGEGESCLTGRCQETPDAATYVARILTRENVGATGSTRQMVAVAVSPDDATDTLPGAAIDWTVAEGDATIDAAGLLTLGDTAGAVTVEARVAANSADPGDSVVIDAVDAAEDREMLVIVFDESTRAAIEGASVLLVGDDFTETGLTDDAGRVRWDDLDGGDLHVFADGYAYVSVYGLEDGTHAVALTPTQRARITEVRDGFVCDTEDPFTTLDETECGSGDLPPCLCYELENIDVVKGVPSFENVAGGGELDISLSGFSLGNTLLDLNFDLIVGPNIERIIPPNPVINLDDPVDIPSGVTMYFNNSPFVDSFIGTAPAGERTLWSIGGSVPLGETLVELLPSLSGDLEFGPIIAAVLPLFEDFYSGVTESVTLTPGGTFPVRDPGLVLEVPTQRRLEVDAPALPEVGEAWADTFIVLGGALVPGEGFVPTGVSGATDVVGRGAADGIVDADEDEDGNQNPFISMAPIHGSINTSSTQYLFASVALTLGDVPGAPREATSGLLTAIEPGGALPSVLEYGREAFPPIPAGSSWSNDEGERTLALEGNGADWAFYRVVFRGDGDRLWVVYVPADTESVVLPEPAEDYEDRVARGRANVVGVGFRGDAVTYGELFEANGTNLPELFELVDRFAVAGF